MTLQPASTRHAGAVCARCGGNMLPREDEIACIQCGHIQCYLDRPHPQLDQPYADPRDPFQREKPAVKHRICLGMTQAQAKAAFRTNHSALQWIAAAKWPHGPACHHCGEPSAKPLGNEEEIAVNEHHCPACPRRYTLLSETPLLGSGIKAACWLLGTWHLKSRPDLADNPPALGRKLNLGERAAKTIIQAFRQAEDEGREIYLSKREAQRRLPPRTEADDMNDPTPTDPASIMGPDHTPYHDPEPEPRDTDLDATPEPPANHDQDNPAETPDRPDTAPEPAPERTAEPETAPEAEAQRETPPDPEPEPPPQTPPDPEPAYLTPPWPTQDATENTMQECRADLVRKREILARKKQKLEAEIRDNEERISKLDEVARYIEEWKQSRK